MKITIQTMSTKCQYRPAISMNSACSAFRRPVHETRRHVEQPEDADRHVGAVEAVSVKNDEPNRLCSSVSPSW